MLNNKELTSDIHDAVKQIGFILKEELGMPNTIVDLNQGRYKILIYKDQAVMIAFKREMYLKFEEGRGETINKDDLYTAIRQYNIKRIFIAYSDGKIYTISPYTILGQGIARTTETENKEVISFPVKCLIRFKEFKDSL